MLESYFRNGRRIDVVWQYNITNRLEEFRNKFPVVVQYDQFPSSLNYCVTLFREIRIFKQRIENLEQLRQRITEKIHAVNNTPALLQNIFNRMKRRERKCLEADGSRNFQHLL
ncbi:hypothetical protein BDFB_008694, partial [Asbolus verrucosus]